MNRAPLVLAAFFMQLSGALAQAPCQAKLDMHWHDQLLTVSGHCRSLLAQPAHYRYQLLVVRQSRGGRAQNSQGGEFLLAPQQDVVLAEVHLNTGPKDFYHAQLFVFDLNGHPVATDSISQGIPGH